MSSFVTVGKTYIDRGGAGRPYLKKRIMNALNFEHDEEVRIEVFLTGSKVIVTKI
ncbi:hypothetical protein GAH_01062 [Geoglobus ahangari]|uniref:Uncharacterized protein n=1 Tax=Geoglobus ahangari TaxID=113653 RepID=A0A0F7IG90_9EURY|nr:hypothetical protein [Geoglobus ahangari]AKG91618.1 hypothetical protein GAH_01062 [Geoglobus ahangari]